MKYVYSGQTWLNGISISQNSVCEGCSVWEQCMKWHPKGLCWPFSCHVWIGQIDFMSPDEWNISLCPKSPSARGLVASTPVRLLFKSI